MAGVGCRVLKGPLQHDGDPAAVAADQGGGLFGGADQEDAVHPMADEKIKDLPDVPVLHPAVAEQYVVALLAGQLLQTRAVSEKSGLSRSEITQPMSPARLALRPRASRLVRYPYW